MSQLLVVGQEASAIHLGAAREGSSTDEPVLLADGDAALAFLRGALRPGDVVLVKASRAAGLERVALALTAEDETGYDGSMEADA